MNEWNEIKTAYEVARLGTVSAAADELGVHRATVLRHIDALEGRLGVKLFIRNARGYLPTDSGKDLLRVAQATDEQFSYFIQRAKGHSSELSGDFIITSIDPIAPLLMPAIKSFRAQHPKINIRYLTSEKVFKLEYGQAHIAIRTGPKPDIDDYVVQPFFNYKIRLYAHLDYIAAKGKLLDGGDIDKHNFITVDHLNTKISSLKWMESHVPPANIVFRSNSSAMRLNAMKSSLGIGLLFDHEAKQHADLVEIFPSQKEWLVSNWIVTHGDLHRSEKIQAFLRLLKGEAYRETILSWLEQ
jgi:DNA-binding transcriptional LysR family regulator